MGFDSMEDSMDREREIERQRAHLKTYRRWRANPSRTEDYGPFLGGEGRECNCQIALLIDCIVIEGRMLPDFNKRNDEAKYVRPLYDQKREGKGCFLNPVLNLISVSGCLQFVKRDDLKKELSNIDALTLERIDELAEEYLQAAKEGKHTEWTHGFSDQYSVSKVLMNAYARVLAKFLSDRPEGKKIFVNFMSPGLTATDMTAGYCKVGRTVEHAADTATWIALFPAGGPTGHSVRDRADHPL